MVTRFNVSPAQHDALERLAARRWPVTARELRVRVHILKGCADRKLAGALPDPAAPTSDELARWHITPAGREYLRTGVFVRDE